MMFADVIDGTLTAIPRGIFSCAGVMNGARGGVDIPDDDREAVMSRIARYYERMREAFDDDSIQMPGMEEDKMGDGCRVTGVRERLAELKAQYLGPHAEGDMTWAALRDLTDTLFWYVVADVLFSSDAPLVEKIDFLRSAFDEYRDIAIRVIESLMGAMEPMEEAEAALKAVFRDPKEVSLSALAAESFETQIGTALAAVETVTARGKVILALRARDGRTLSGERKKRLAEVRAAIDALTETVATRASRPDLAQVILREAEALERAALYGG